MPSYEQNDNSRLWSVRFRETTITGTINKRLSGFKSKKDAQAGYIKYCNEKLAFKENASSNITMSELIDSYRAYCANRNKESTQYEQYRIQDNYILPYFGDKKLNEITKKNVAEWQEILNSKKLSYNYKCKLRYMLSALFKYAVLFFDLPTNPVTAIPSFRNLEAKNEMKIWSVNQFNQFISVVDDLNYKSFFTLLYYTGMRKGEALALTWKDINLTDAFTVTVNKSLTKKVENASYAITTPKNESSNRVIKMPQVLVNALEILYNEKKPEKSYFVFGTPEKPLAETTLTRHYKEYCNLAEIEPIRLHDFRHSHASLLISMGESIVMVAKRLGHSNIEQTLDTYAHLMPDEENKMIASLDNLGANLGTTKNNA